MKLRYIKINWLSRKTQTDGRLNTIATQQRFTRCFNEGSVAARTPLPAPVQNETATAPLFDLHERRHNYLRISLTERCNLRCQYCMPAEGVPLSARAALLTRLELTRLVATFARLGVDKLRLTGGEPTLRPDLADIIQELSSIRGIASVGITTNGLVLTRRLPALQRAGLTHLNVSLDSLQKDKYEAMSRRPGLARVLAGIDLALQLGYRPVKINVVLMKGFNDDEIGDFVEYTRDREVEVRFIEFMPFTGNRWDVSRLVPYRTALRAAAAAGHDLRPEPPRQNDTAKVWRAAGHSGTAGFITSMTEHFCGTCNRLRLTADGNLKVCLFGSAEVSLRDAIRGGASEPELEALVRAALRNKKPQHAAAVCDGIKRGRVSATHRPLTRSPFARHAGLGRLREPAHDPHRRVVRAFSSRAKGDAGALSHLDAAGQARMVDVGDKAVTRREAIAQCHVEVNARLVRLLRDARLPKGDALCVARVAGTLAAKRTADLIPLCHPLPIESVQVSIDLPRGDCDRGGEVKITCAIRVTARTGAEMEALTGCSVAALTLYDMCKSVDRAMRITGLRVVHKSGGKSDVPREPPPPLREPSRDPLDAPETFAPTNFMNF